MKWNVMKKCDEEMTNYSEMAKKKKKTKVCSHVLRRPLPLCGWLSQTVQLRTTCLNSLRPAATCRSCVRSHLKPKVPGDFQSNKMPDLE